MNELIDDRNAHHFDADGVCKFCHKERAALKMEGLGIELARCVGETDILKEGQDKIRDYFEWAQKEMAD